MTFRVGIIGIVTLLSARPGLAAEIMREYRSPSMLGMGDAGMAGARGADAIFLNPAGISDVKGILNEVVVVSPTVLVSTNSKKLAVDAKNGATAMGKGSEGGGTSSGVESALQASKGLQNKPQGGYVQNFTGVVFRRAALGVLTSAKTSAMIGSNALGLPTIDAVGMARGGVYFSAARGFFKEELLLGFTYKYIAKGEYITHVDALDLQTRLEAVSNELKSATSCGEYLKCGTASGVDVGMVYKDTSSNLKPRFGLVVRNIGDTKYSATSQAGTAPTSEKQSVDVSFGFEPQTKKSGMRIFADFKDVLNRQKENVYKRLHLGGDISFSGVVGVMGGLGQGYPSYGAFLNLKVVRIEGGIYTEEFGKYASQIADKRYFGRIILGWAQ